MSEIPTEVTEVMECYSEPALLIGLDYTVLAANSAYKTLYGDDGLRDGQRCFDVNDGTPVSCDTAGESCPVQVCRESGQPQRLVHVHHTRDGDQHVNVEARPIRDASGNITCFLEVLRSTRSASPEPRGEGLIGRSRAFNRMLELVERVAATEIPVLLAGESGTGKELVARTIHDSSPRGDGPFVPVECSGLTESLFETELFGHERGAFTGAHSRKLGLVEAAAGGTLFLDEIGDIPLPLQVKLLRLLETGTYRRVGSVEPLEAGFRLVCATHRDLQAMVKEGSFRTDLYYRISSFPIPLPSLRERGDDLDLLVKSLLGRVAPERRLRLSPEAMARLRGYEFPGNVRELRNVLQRASLLTDGEVILAEHLPADWAGHDPEPLPVPDAHGDEEIVPLRELERRYLRRIVARHGGDRQLLAQRLGVSQRTLYRKLSELKDPASPPPAE